MDVLFDPDLIDRPAFGNPSPVGRRIDARGSAVARGMELAGISVHGGMEEGCCEEPGAVVHGDIVEGTGDGRIDGHGELDGANVDHPWAGVGLVGSLVVETGVNVGANVGANVGTAVGAYVGANVGANVGIMVGRDGPTVPTADLFETGGFATTLDLGTATFFRAGDAAFFAFGGGGDLRRTGGGAFLGEAFLLGTEAFLGEAFLLGTVVLRTGDLPREGAASTTFLAFGGISAITSARKLIGEIGRPVSLISYSFQSHQALFRGTGFDGPAFCGTTRLDATVFFAAAFAGFFAGTFALAFVFTFFVTTRRPFPTPPAAAAASEAGAGVSVEEGSDVSSVSVVADGSVTAAFGSTTSEPDEDSPSMDHRSNPRFVEIQSEIPATL